MIEITSLIIAISINMGFDPILALAVAKVESNYNPAQVGKIGEIGLFQLRPEFFSATCTGIKSAYIKRKPRFPIIKEMVADATTMTPKVFKRSKSKEHLCGTELFDIKTNITTAISHLKKTKHKFSYMGDFGFLVAYNSGYTKALKFKNPGSSEYATKVRNEYKKIAAARLPNKTKKTISVASNF